MYTYNEKNQIPQLRVLVTSRCNSKCIYCRPGGETFCIKRENELTPEKIEECVKELVKYGLTNIKISGGEPALRSDICDIVKRIKKINSIEYIELITRDPAIISYLEQLENDGLDCINFSLDTLDKEKWEYVNGRRDFRELISAIKCASKKKMKLKINSVLCMERMEEINDLISFLQELGGGTLKLLDLIGDIVDNKRNSIIDFSKCITPEAVASILDKTCLEKKVIYPPGGIGHPMLQYFMSDNVDVIIKTSKAGAFYHENCKQCVNFPCYDALMAMRLTPDGKLQKCLLGEGNMIELAQILNDKEKSTEGIKCMLDNYLQATFYSYDEIEQLRGRKNAETTNRFT